MVSADLRDFGMVMFTMAEFACLLCRIARAYCPSEEVSKSDIKYLTDFILYTVRKSLGTDAEVNRLVKDLYNVDFQVVRLRDQSELYSVIVEKENGKRLAAISAGGSITHYTSTQHLLALKIRRILVEIIFSQQIKSPESLYPHVNKAVQALHNAFCGHRCVIGGEPINVVGAKDEYVLAPCYVEHEDSVEHGSASACLYNLRGTTSYMTATIQCLHRVPELNSALIKWHPLFETSSDHLLTAATRDLFKELDKNSEPVAPRVFLQLFEEKYPALGQQDNHNPKDAEKCWMQLLGTLSRSLKSPDFSSENLDIVGDLFGIKLVSRVHCQGEKPPVEKTVLMLEWHVSSLVDHLHDGLRVFLESGLNKASPLCIGGLPRYLTIRFFRTKHRANYKNNLLEVDVYKLCSNELRAKLKAAREGSSNRSGDSCKATSEEGQETQFTGVYDLITFLAHDKTPYHNKIKSPGHYAIFIKPENIGRTLNWFNYVDENYFRIRQRYVKEIMRGGNGFVPYICLYKARVVN